MYTKSGCGRKVRCWSWKWKYKVALSYVGMDCAISSIICHAAPPPVDLGQRGVVLRCFEALTGDGQLLVSAVY